MRNNEICMKNLTNLKVFNHCCCLYINYPKRVIIEVVRDDVYSQKTCSYTSHIELMMVELCSWSRWYRQKHDIDEIINIVSSLSKQIANTCDVHLRCVMSGHLYFARTFTVLYNHQYPSRTSQLYDHALPNHIEFVMQHVVFTGLRCTLHHTMSSKKSTIYMCGRCAKNLWSSQIDTFVQTGSECQNDNARYTRAKFHNVKIAASTPIYTLPVDSI